MVEQDSLEEELGRLLVGLAAGPVEMDSVERVRASAMRIRRRRRLVGAIGIVTALLGLGAAVTESTRGADERNMEVLSAGSERLLPSWVPSRMVLRSARPPVTAPVVYQAVYRDRPGRRWVTLTAIAATDTGGPGGSPEEFRTADGARATLTHKEHVESWWFAVRADSHIKVDATFQGFTHDEALAAAKTIHPAAGSGPDAFELDPGAGMTRTLAGSPPWKAHRMTISYADRPGSGRYLQIDTYRTTAAITDLFRANSILDRIVSVRGHKAVVLRPGPATTTTAVAWTEGPGVVVSVSTKGLGASATTKIARSLRQVSDATWKQQTSRVPR